MSRGGDGGGGGQKMKLEKREGWGGVGLISEYDGAQHFAATQ